VLGQGATARCAACGHARGWRGSANQQQQNRYLDGDGVVKNARYELVRAPFGDTQYSCIMGPPHSLGALGL